MERTAVYTGTRNIYHDMLVSAKSLLFHNGADRVYFLIEDDTFPEPLPDCITPMNISGQTFFPASGPNFKSRWTYMVMIRIALAKIFPKLDRILSLDHDTIVRKPVDYLWNLDLGSHYFAAVEEKQITIRQHPYYNFGVVLHNLAQLRDGMDDTIIRLLNTTYFGFCEQDAANSICRNNILPLLPEYNAFGFQKPCVSEDEAIIRHYAAYNSNLRTFDDYKFYEKLSWDQILSDRKGEPSMPLVKRYDVINRFIRTRNYASYLEIGTDRGESFRNVIAPVKVTVDPDPSSPATFHVTSDEFFANINKAKFDIIFIDGLHEHNQACRDIQNALRCLNEGGVIVIHDCLPTSELMQKHSDHYPGGLWTGDVWKAFVHMRAQLPYYMYTIDTDFGCGVIDTHYTTEVKQKLPSDMETMTYAGFVQHRDEWMNVQGGIYDAEE